MGAEAEVSLTKNQVALQVTQVFTTLVAENYRQRTIQTLMEILKKMQIKSFKNNQPFFAASIANLEAHLSASHRITARTKVEFRYLTGVEFQGSDDLLHEAIVELRKELRIPRNLKEAFEVANTSPNLKFEQAKIQIAKNKEYLSVGTNLPEIEYQYTPDTQVSGSQFGTPFQSQGSTHGITMRFGVNPAKAAFETASAADNLSAANDDYTAALLNLKKDIEITYLNLPGSIATLQQQLKALRDSGIVAQLIPRFNDSLPIFSFESRSEEGQASLINSLNEFEHVGDTVVASYSDIMMMQAKLLSSLGVLDEYSKRNNPIFSYDPFKEVESQQESK